MEQKSWIAVGVLAAVVIIAAAIVSSTGKEESPLSAPVQQQTDNREPLVEEAKRSDEPVVVTTTPQNVTPPPVTPSAAAPKVEAGPTRYTMSQVQAHATKSSCWTVVRGNVYDVTAFATRHPGGEEAIASLCGRDGTTFFEGQHGGDRRPESALESLKIGVLAK